MLAHMSKWNHGAGVSLEGWVGALGSFDLAVGYSTLFWPTFEINGKYVFIEGCSKKSIKGFENQAGSTPHSVEWVLNHIHIADVHGNDDDIPTPEHCFFLGNVLKEIYEAKLKWQFPDRPCEVEFYVPEDKDDIIEYQLSFWQKKWLPQRKFRFFSKNT